MSRTQEALTERPAHLHRAPAATEPCQCCKASLAAVEAVRTGIEGQWRRRCEHCGVSNYYRTRPVVPREPRGPRLPPEPGRLRGRPRVKQGQTRSTGIEA